VERQQHEQPAMAVRHRPRPRGASPDPRRRPAATRSLATATAAIAIVLPDGQDAISHAYDEGRAAERMLIAASFLGLGAGIAWVMPHIRGLVAELLGLPGDRFVRTIVVIGHPTDRALSPKNPPGKARLPRDQVVFEDRWPSH
jgi:nitroreductase